MTQVRMLPDIELELELGSRIEVNALPGEENRLIREIVEQAIAGRLDHRTLPGRQAEKQHPVSAIDGLAGELKRIPAPAEALTNSELEELLK